MTDDERNMGFADRHRITLDEDYEIRDRTASLRLGEAALREAVDPAGNSADKVRVDEGGQ